MKRYESIKLRPAVMRFADVSAFISADVHDRGYYPRRGMEILSLSPSRRARMSLGGFVLGASANILGREAI